MRAALDALILDQKGKTTTTNISYTMWSGNLDSKLE